MIDAGDGAAVNVGADNASYVSAMPVAFLSAGTRGKVAFARFRRGDPIAGIGSVAIAAIAVVGRLEGSIGIGTDKIKARQQSPHKIGMIEHARVDDGDGRGAGTSRGVPRGRRVDAAGGFGQIPLRHDLTTAEINAGTKSRIIRRKGREHFVIRFGVFDVGVCR